LEVSPCLDVATILALYPRERVQRHLDDLLSACPLPLLNGSESAA